ncbi:hypothetical protein A9Q81_26030 [Gammaproteobacteria bacterium 42_54_T18]|nr:hypothetical protein A9Q81_26030 [Gammaproteobacteria bacterium 42_54_T18]
MEIIVYFEGDNSVKDWFTSVMNIQERIIYKKMPTRNDTAAYSDLPAYVSDILYLDKPDLIVSMIHDGHEKPLLSIEFASCTPQYQHALQRFSRMLASVTTGCPSVLIIPFKKRSNDGASIYTRSASIEYGAVRLMDIFKTPCFILDWTSDENHFLVNEPNMQYPLINSDGINSLKSLIQACIQSRQDINYSDSLFQKKIVHELTDKNRTNAYRNGVPTILNPSGGTGNSRVKLDLLETVDVLDEIRGISAFHKSLCDVAPKFIKDREKSLAFYPTRITAHAGDPYVGMIGYYDIAFTRFGRSTRDRHYNLVAYAKNVSIHEVTDVMSSFVDNKCPFTDGLSGSNSKMYNYHLKNGCKETKTKPVRIYAELADIVIFSDGVLFNAG